MPLSFTHIQSFQGPADLICVNDSGIGQPQNAGAATVAFGHKPLGDQNIQSLANGNLRRAKLPGPTPFDDFLARSELTTKNSFTELDRQALLQQTGTWRCSAVGGWSSLRISRNVAVR